MDLNEKLMGMEQETGIPVFPDFAPAQEEKSITFTYEDEKPVLHGNNCPVADTAYLQISLYTPEGFDYMPAKHAIRDYLEGAGFSVTSIQSWLDQDLTGTKRTRHTVFEANYTEMRKEI